MATDTRDLSAADPQPPAPSVQSILDLDALALVARLNQPDGDAMIAALAPDQAQTLVDRLKEGADRHWSINPNRSLEMADIILKIGETRGDVQQRALGLMARGDALKLMGHSQEAWDTLEVAGNLFREAGDEVGWARTRIGRLVLSVNINLVKTALQEAEQARLIFRHDRYQDLLLRLDINTAYVYYFLGDHQQSLRYYSSALNYTQILGTSGNVFEATIYVHLGVLHCDLMGAYSKALHYLSIAHDLATYNHEKRIIALAELNTALIYVNRGQITAALKLLLSVREIYVQEELESDVNHVDALIVECYLTLNRNAEAKELVMGVIAFFRVNQMAFPEAHALLQLAKAEAELNCYDLAKGALKQAKSIYENINSNTWTMNTGVLLGLLEKKEGNFVIAKEFAESAIAYFSSIQQHLHLTNAQLLKAETDFASEAFDEVVVLTKNVLVVARQSKLPVLRYKAHLLLGRVAESQGDLLRAIRHYHASVATIERIQQGMTITLRTGFMEDKGEALKRLIALYMHLYDVLQAFETLERAKSQAFFEYIANRQLLRWPQDDPECHNLIEELDQLRDEHHWWYQRLHGEMQGDTAPSIAIAREDALCEVGIRERRMRSITEQLYLYSSANADLNQRRAPRLPDIQAALDEDTLLVAYYHDGETVWAFVVDRQGISAHVLPNTAAMVERDINFLQLSIDRALTQGMPIPSEATAQAQRILRRLYNGLLAPLADQLFTYHRLIVVPYGNLHYLPFHLLHSGASYLIETHEVMVEPAASYVVQRGPDRSGGARVIAHSWAGALPSASIEGRTVHDLFAGELFQEDAANRQALAAPPTQILHIAAHAEYRLDQPDLSYIELADGQLRTDDLLQQDLSYELVTLSACETGRAYVAASDELIGLGRGFLYAGAGALVASLWRVADEIVQRVMTTFYQELRAGDSKAAALRHAQRVILADQPDLHPAFWGAFQLMGDPRPLSHSEGEPL